jgi:cyclase
MRCDEQATMDTSTWLLGPPRNHTRFGEAARFREGLYRLTEGTYAWMVPNGSWGETNLGLIDCDGTSVLIDTCWDLAHTQEMLAMCKQVLSASPLGHVINTHADGDHCWGNQLFKHLPIHATQACIDQMHHIPPRSLSALQHASAGLRHVPLAGIDTFGRYMGEMLRPYRFKGVRITPANQAFAGRQTLCVNGVDLHLIEVGPAHTQGDAIVHVPSRGVVYAGDILFVDVTPVMWAGPVEKLIQGLQSLIDLNTDTIVPGHGPLASRQDVQAVIDYWRFGTEAIGRCQAQGMRPFEATQEVLHSQAFKASVWAQWDSPERLLTSAHALYRQWGVPPPTLPGKLGQIDLMRQQALLAQGLPQATPRVMHQP